MHRRSVISLLGLGALPGCGGGGGGGSGASGVSAASGSSGAGRSTGTGAPAIGRRVTEFRDLLQIGTSPAYWIEDGVWNAVGLTRGTYTGLGGTQFETTYSRSTALGANGEIAWRSGWKFPTGSTEVKAFQSAIFGSKPGYANTWVTPGGCKILLPDNSYSTTYPSGATPGSFLPVTGGPTAAWPDMFASFAYAHPIVPTGQGQLSFDLWLQNSPVQVNGFDAAPITHEVMISIDWWGDYGAYGHRNPAWYSHDAVIDARLWHVYFVRKFSGGWTFVVFQPDAPLGAGSLNLGAFLRHLSTRRDSGGQPWANGSEYLVSIELGVEPAFGVGEASVSGYRVWRT